MKKSNDISVRAWLIFTLLAFSGIAILAKVFVIQTTDSEKWTKKSTRLDRKVMTITPTRGRILSSDGNVLAITVPEYSLHWDPRCDGLSLDTFYKYENQIIEEFALIIPNLNKAAVKASFKEAIHSGNRYKRIIPKVSYDQKAEIQKIDFVKKGQYKSGFIFDRKNRRQKFFGELASRTIGTTIGDSLKGNVGLELHYNKQLAGVEGKQVKELIPGNQWKPISESYIQEPIEGYDLVSTIDIHLQDLVQTSLEKSLIKSEAEWGCAILMEVQTGKIRGISNLGRNADGSYSEELNYAIQKSNDPGSTFKLPALLACFEDGLINMDDPIDTEGGRKKYYNKWIEDTENHGKGTVSNVFQWSSNVGMAKILTKCYGKDNQLFLDRINAFHLGDKLGLELAGETQPKIYKTKNQENFSGISLVQMSMGYEVNLSPIQILAFYNSIANDGKMIKPMFAEEIKENNKTIQVLQTVTIDDQICSASTLDKAQTLLKMVCEEGGTAYDIFKNRNYKVAGKTGTVDAYNENVGGYVKGENRGSFVGYFPADKPKYSIIVVVHRPKGLNYYGSYVAAPVFRDIADKIQASSSDFIASTDTLGLENIRITPISMNGSKDDLVALYKSFNIDHKIDGESHWVNIQTKDRHVEGKSFSPNFDYMPDFKGFSLQDAVFLLENAGFRVIIKGTGKITEQSIKKGTKINNDRNITLTLS